MPFPTVPLAFGAAALWLLHKKGQASPAFSTVASKSGRKWLTRTLGVTGTGTARTTTVEVWAPAGAYGPHNNVLVATYRQQGSDMNTRVAASTGPDAVPQMITDAGVDFGIRKPA